MLAAGVGTVAARVRRAVPECAEHVVELGEQLGVRPEAVEVAAQAQMAGRQRELRVHGATLDRDRGLEIRREHEVGCERRSADRTEPTAARQHMMRVGVGPRPRDALLDDERRLRRSFRRAEFPERRIELDDPRGGEELGHGRGSYWREASSPTRYPTRYPTYAHPVPASARRVTGVPPSLAEVGRRAEVRVVGLLDAEIQRWATIDSDLEEPLTALRTLVLAGGKRLRPAFCHWAYVGAGGDPGSDEVVDAGAALELLHTFALVHDDIMDGSDRRRGNPSIHAHFVARHAAQGWRAEGRRFGEGAAILIGDLAFVYADVLFGANRSDARHIFDELRIELCIGQYLDLVGTASGSSDPTQAARIERYKSGKYTVERPLHLGAALAGRLDELGPSLSEVGLPLGEAFQLRDDLLGVFGDASVTGKPVGDDLREGKLTPLVAVAAGRADAAGTALLARLGRPDLTEVDIAALQDLLVSSGARDDVEAAIERLVDESLAALEVTPITPEARQALEELGTYVAWRDH